MRGREAQWRRRAKKLVSLARDAQTELLAKTIRYCALVAVLTPEETAELNQRIRAHNAARKAILAAKRAAP